MAAAENHLQLTERFPNPKAQVRAARTAISHSIGGPGNNNFVTILERVDSRRRRDPVAPPRLHFESRHGRPERESASPLHGAEATVEAATTNQLECLPDLPESDRRSRAWGFGWRLN